MRTLAVIALVLVPCAAEPAGAQQPDGKAVFERHCVHCHGDSLEAPGTLQLGRTRGADKRLLVGRKDLNAQYIEHVVRNGLRTMPSFVPSELTDAKLRALTNYLLRSP